MHKIIHVTDTHLCADGRRVLGVDPAQNLRDVVRSINENHADAVLCVLTGDIADAGEAAAYELAGNILDELRVPLAVTLGNHDSRAAFATSYPQAPASDCGFVHSIVEVDDFACVLLDTLAEDHAGQGRVCGTSLQWLDAELDRLSDRRVIVFMHHPPLSIGIRWFDGLLLSNGAEVMDTLVRHGNVLHVAFGHVHLGVSGTWRGISFSGSRGTCHKILADPAADCAEYVDQGPAYDVLLVGDDGVTVHTIDPAGPNRLIARERMTEDEHGAFEHLRNATIDRWM